MLADPIAAIGSFQAAVPEPFLRRQRLLAPESRAAFRRLLDQGWTDAVRAIHPSGPLWTFWSYLRFRWPKDKGLRIDHLLLSPDLATQLADAGVDRWVRDLEGTSDHAPTWIDLDR